jgi:outer membrane biosynthesis protein TonB
LTASVSLFDPGGAAIPNAKVSPSDDLTQSALDAVRQWRYSPTLLNGQPVEVVTEVMINYTLAR